MLLQQWYVWSSKPGGRKSKFCTCRCRRNKKLSGDFSPRCFLYSSFHSISTSWETVTYLWSLRRDPTEQSESLCCAKENAWDLVRSDCSWLIVQADGAKSFKYEINLCSWEACCKMAVLTFIERLYLQLWWISPANTRPSFVGLHDLCVCAGFQKMLRTLLTTSDQRWVCQGALWRWMLQLSMLQHMALLHSARWVWWGALCLPVALSQCLALLSHDMLVLGRACRLQGCLSADCKQNRNDCLDY